MVPREVIDQIREAADIVQVVSAVVTLQRRGSSMVGLCPFHSEKSPSFNVLPHKHLYHCFGCNETGDVFSFVQKTRGVSFFEAVKEIGESVGIQVDDREMSREERQRIRAQLALHDVLSLAADHFHATLVARPEGREAFAYLESRGVSRETMERWRLGYAVDRWDGLLSALHRQGVSADMAIRAGLARPGREDRGSAYDLFRGRIMVPIEDARGRIVAFGGRILPSLDGANTPKYVNSPETPVYRKSSVLFGLNRARTAIQRDTRALIVEGYFDVISLHQAGFTGAIATCGTALTPDHLRILRPMTRTVVALFDADEAGQRAAERSMALFVDAGIEARRLEIGDAKDPDELIQKHGAEALTHALDRSEPLLDLVLRRLMATYGATPGGRQECFAKVQPLLEKMEGPALRGATSLVAQRLHLMEQEIADAIQNARRGGSADTGPVSPVAPPRWLGSKYLNHLLWMLIHYPDAVIPILADPSVDPHRLTDRPAALEAMSRLMAGESFPTILEKLDDVDVKRVLLKAVRQEDLYTEQTAPQAARQILLRLEVESVRRSIAEVDHLLATTNPKTDWSTYSSYLEQKKRATARKNDLERQIRGSNLV